MEHRDDRLDDLWQSILGGYVLVAKFLAALPLPIVLADIRAVDTGIIDMVKAMDRARTLVEDEPISDAHRSAHERLALEWLTAYDQYGVIRVEGPNPWRFDALEHTLKRLTFTASLIEAGVIDEALGDQPDGS